MSKHNPTAKETRAAAEDQADAKAATEKAAADNAATKGETTIGETVEGLKQGDGNNPAAAEAQQNAMQETQTTGAAPSNPNPPADPNAPIPTAGNLSTVMPNAPVPRLSPQSAYPDEPTITMIAPRAFKVQYAQGMFAHFKEGPQEVPTSLQAHPYVVAHGVKVYNKA